MDEYDQSLCTATVKLLQLIEARGLENELYFTGPNRLDGVDIAFRQTFVVIQNSVAELIPLVTSLYEVAAQYDAVKTVRANGVRSWLRTVHRFAGNLKELCDFIEVKRDSVLFRRVKIVRELRTLSDYSVAVLQILNIIKLCAKLSPNSLIVDNRLDRKITIDEVLEVINATRQINVSGFCGRTPSFHVDPSTQGVCRAISVGFAAYCKTLEHSLVLLGEDEKKKNQKNHRYIDFLTSGDAFSEQICRGGASLTLNGWKGFWSLIDNPALKVGVNLLYSRLTFSHGINIHSVPITVTTENGTRFALDPPALKPIKARILSDVIRMGHEYWLHSGRQVEERNLRPPTDTIIFVVHGGGFICQTAQSVEVYLRDYFEAVKVPFFCVDYSLLPNEPFPRAADEVLFAYCWMLNNMEKLGSTGKRIICFGDSAGCGLLLSMFVNLIRLNIRRPDEALFVYPFTCAGISQSPSRLLAVIDPVLPITLLLRCLLGYASFGEKEARTLIGLKRVSGAPEDDHPHLFNDNLIHSNRLHRARSVPGELHLLTSLSHSSTGPSEAKAVPINVTRRSSEATGLHYNFAFRPMTSGEKISLRELLQEPIFDDVAFSPLMAPDYIMSKFPSSHIVAAEADPLLDDSIELCRRMLQVGAKCTLQVYEGMPHGFLNMSLISKTSKFRSDDVKMLLASLVRQV